MQDRQLPTVRFVSGHYYNASVVFEDGHVLHVIPRLSMESAPIDGIRILTLYRQENGRPTVFEYDMVKSHVVKIKSVLTQQQFADYWYSAILYLHAEYFKKPKHLKNENLWLAWATLNHYGKSDLAELQAGIAQVI